jgi:hypothetical protein
VTVKRRPPPCEERSRGSRRCAARRAPAPRAAARAAAVLAALAAAAGCGVDTAAEPAVTLPRPAVAIGVAPDFSGTIWAATGGRPLRSGDGGHTWRSVPGAAGAQAVSFGIERTVAAGPSGVQTGGFGGRRLSRPRAVPAEFVSVATPWYRTDRLYAVDDRGSLWLSVRGGGGWVRLRADGLPASAASIAAVRGDPHRPDTIYVAAGGAGLWCSRDFGRSFERLGPLERADAVAATPADQGRLLVAAGRLVVSTDGGRSFRAAGPPARAVAYDLRNWRLAFAATADGRLLRSIDGGESFDS